MLPKILITGASGYLAHRLVPVAGALGNVVGLARRGAAVVSPATPVSFDLSDPQAIPDMVRSIRPAAIIHTAAVSPGDGDERMNAVNHIASAALAKIAREVGSRFVMVSTDTVHSGDAAPYNDSARADPINHYGQSKAAGEDAVMSANSDAVIVRTSLIYGLQKIDRGTSGFRDRVLRGEPLVLFDDVIRQPVWADSLSDALCALALEYTDISGTMNVVGSEAMSRAQFGLLMMKYWGIDPGADVSFRSGKDLPGVQLDLSCSCERADALGFKRPGVNEVLSSQSG